MSFKLTVAQDKAMDVLISDAIYIALGGGSRSGKTFLLVRAVITRALKCKSRHAIFRYRFNACKQSVVLETLPDVMALCFPGLMTHCTLDKTDWYLMLPNGSEIWFGGLDDKERVEKILGKEYATMYFNEASQIPYQSYVLALSRLAQKTENLKLKVYVDFNPPSRLSWLYRLFVEHKDPDSKQSLQKPEQYGFYLINPGDNRENLDPQYLAILDAMPEKQRNRFLLGKFADVSDGQFWTEDVLATNRILLPVDMPDLLRIVVAIDPSGCSGPEDTRSDEVGIVVAGLGTNGHGYLLEDLSGRYGPHEWGTIAVEAYHRHHCDRIVAENNYGGAMVQATIEAIEPDLPYQDACATRGKHVRAEPISALYEKGRFHHYGYFPELEEQLTGFTAGGYTGLRSPDRADACLVAETLVTTDRGEIPISEVTLGDKVLTRDGYFPLTWCGKTRDSAETYAVSISDGRTIKGTCEHPVWVVGKGFVRIDELMCGDILETQSEGAPNHAGNELPISSGDTRSKSRVPSVAPCFGSENTSTNLEPAQVSVVRICANGAQAVYNLHVGGPHEFYANGVLVHNCIWAATALFPSMTASLVNQDFRPPKVLAAPRSASRYSHRRG